MAADDLSAPLGRHKKRRSKLPATLPLAAAGFLSLSLLVFVLWAAVSRDPLGGEPIVVMSVDTRGPTKKPDEAASAEKPEPKTAPADAATANPAAAASKGTPPGMQSVTIIDGASGNRQEVLVPSQGSGQPAAQPAQRSAAVDQKLLETTRHGSIPRVAADGARPLTAYARPAGDAKANLPRVALVIGGLGIASSSTAEAMAKLPAPVSFAFLPYATDVDRLVAAARGEGHEVLLQLPMEPFDFPDNDPGPQTLLTSLAPEQNIDRMHWLMSRFQGYVGVVNYMGARFTASEPAFGPVLREVAKRGLMYVDDGSSPRSIASQIAGASNLPFVKAEIVLDAVPTPGEIERALSRLETAARETGLAVGIASALPVSIARIVQWAKTAQTRGFALVPISAAAVKPKAS